MSKGQLTSDTVTMDVRLQQNPQLHFGINGATHRDSRGSEDEALQFLSQEEQECLLFFEETIDSLEESLVEEECRPKTMGAPPRGPHGAVVEEVDGYPSYPPPPSALNPSIGPVLLPPERHSSPKDQDIIDLVQPEPDLLQNRMSHVDPSTTDFQSLWATADTHFENKPRRESNDALPSEYNPPIPGNFYGSADVPYPPPGCIPTPVLIAHQIAENRGGGSSSFQPSSFPRHRSLEGEKPPRYAAEHSVKQGPPTSTKPNRFPSNINVMLGSKEHHNQSLANVNIHERRAQMLANLTGSSHPLEQQQDSPQAARNPPTRSVSFRDPTPDKSRMEALSKLGLNRNRAMSGGTSLYGNPGDTAPPPPIDAETSTKTPVLSTPSPLQAKNPETKSVSNPRDKTFHLNPSPLAATTRSTYQPPASVSKPVTPPSEFASLDFNNYGGKSVVVSPSASSQSEPSASFGGNDSNAVPPALEGPTDFNSYGGKSKVMTPVAVPVPKSDLPDILSSHIDKSLTISSPAKVEAVPIEQHSYGARSRTITPSKSVSHSATRTPKSPPPTTAPKPTRHHSLMSPQREVVAQPLSPESRRTSISKVPAFRSQGITVQFSGRGATDESRREALRKLGLLKDTC